MNGSSQPAFWNERYAAARMPWDAQGVPPALRAYLQRRAGAGVGRALVPGCGSAYEVQALHDAGWNVTAIDFCAGAVERARTVLGSLARTVQLADFFADDFGRGFDVIYERTFLCSLPPDCWTAYASRMSDLITPGGVLVGFFFHGRNPEPPPFGLTRAEADALFANAFDLIEDDEVPASESLPLYAGFERWQVWQRRDLTLPSPNR